MRKSIRFITIGLLAALLIPWVWAQGGLRDMPPDKWWTNKRLIAALKLSPDQQSRIDTLWTQHRRGLIDQKAELEKRQMDLAELLGKNSIDENAALTGRAQKGGNYDRTSNSLNCSESIFW